MSSPVNNSHIVNVLRIIHDNNRRHIANVTETLNQLIESNNVIQNTLVQLDKPSIKTQPYCPISLVDYARY